MNHGILHRLKGPAFFLSQNGKITTEYWVKNGIDHRKNGPSSKQLGGITEWKHHGVLHREDGAYIYLSYSSY